MNDDVALERDREVGNKIDRALWHGHIQEQADRIAELEALSLRLAEELRTEVSSNRQAKTKLAVAYAKLEKLRVDRNAHWKISGKRMKAKWFNKGLDAVLSLHDGTPASAWEYLRISRHNIEEMKKEVS